MSQLAVRGDSRRDTLARMAATLEHFAGCVARGGTLRGPIPTSTQGISARASVVAVDVDADHARVFDAMKRAIDAIDGWAFLRGTHTVLVKPGINWGVAGYPSVSSPASISAAVTLALSEGARRGARVRVIVGEQSGVEMKAWGGSTLENMVHTGIYDGAIRAGVAWAAERERGGDRAHVGAGLVLAAIDGEKIGLSHTDAARVAALAGVTCEGFEHAPHVQIPVPSARHFVHGIHVPEVVANDVTDIVNVPRPPGRHVLMGASGLTGAVKSHVGLLGAVDRVPGLHGPFDRYPGLSDGAHATDGFRAHLRRLAERVANDESRAIIDELRTHTRWDADAMGPGAVFQEKLVELYLAVRDKERFSVTDMRSAMSSMGPDIGDTIDVGCVIAASDPVTLDVIAASALKARYERIGLSTLVTLADTPAEYLAGKSFLPDGAGALDLVAMRAAMTYGVCPLSRDAIELFADGFSPDELSTLMARVRAS